MEQFKLKVERCSLCFSTNGDILFICYRAQPFFIEQALAILQQCNDHTDKCDLDLVHIVQLVSGFQDKR